MTYQHPMFPPRADVASFVRAAIGSSEEPVRRRLKSEHRKSLSDKDIADIEFCAAMEFDVWQGDVKDAGTGPFERKVWLTDRVSAVLAHAIMFKSKADLMNMHDDLGEEQINELMEGIRESSDWLKKVSNMMGSAIVRLTAAACAKMVE